MGGAVRRLLVLRRSHAPLEDAALALLLGPQAAVLADLQHAQLALELAVAAPALAVERAGGERVPDRAPRLALVRAVGETTLGGELGDLRERGVERLAVGPELQLAHPGRVQEKPAAARQYDELAVRGRVATALVALSHLARGQQLATGEA